MGLVPLLPMAVTEEANGEWVDAASGKTFESINPATEEVLASVAHGEAEDADRAVRAARAAFEDGSAWRRMPHGRRGKVLHKLGDLILENLDRRRSSRGTSRC